MLRRIQNLVSVVIPVYNNAQYLSECLSSLISQTYKDIEIIIVDDCSTDNCEETLARWKEQTNGTLSENRIVYVKLPRNIKQPGSATTGLFLAGGEFIACQAADDLSHPKRLETQLNFLREHPDVDMVGTTYEGFNDGDFEHRSLEHAGWLAYGREPIRQRYALGQHCVCDGTILMHGRVFDRLGGWTRRMKGVSDFEFVGRYVSSGVVTENLKDVLYYYRVHPGQTTQKLARGEAW